MSCPLASTTTTTTTTTKTSSQRIIIKRRLLPRFLAKGNQHGKKLWVCFKRSICRLQKRQDAEMAFNYYWLKCREFIQLSKMSYHAPACLVVVFYCSCSCEREEYSITTMALIGHVIPLRYFFYPCIYGMWGGLFGGLVACQPIEWLMIFIFIFLFFSLLSFIFSKMESSRNNRSRWSCKVSLAVWFYNPPYYRVPACAWNEADNRVRV